MADHGCLSDAWAKYERADAHADALYREVRAFRNSDPIRIALSCEPESGDYVFRANLRKKVPSREWGLTVGDVLHNLHSALDSLGWQLAIAGLGREPTEDEARGIHFPLAKSPKDFPSWQILQYVAGPVRKRLNDVQPYQAGYESLSVLRDLSVRDKHRAIHPVYLPSKDFRIREPKALRDCEILRVVHAPVGPLKDGYELARVQVRSTGPQLELEGEAKLSGAIALSDRTPLQQLTDEVGTAVREVLSTIEPTFTGGPRRVYLPHDSRTRG